MPNRRVLEATRGRSLKQKPRWVDTNKTNDEISPNYRSRLVAREFKTNDNTESYSGTPPTELMKMIIANVAEAQAERYRWSEDYLKKNEAGDVVLLYSDTSRAYFNAKAPANKSTG